MPGVGNPRHDVPSAVRHRGTSTPQYEATPFLSCSSNVGNSNFFNIVMNFTGFSGFDHAVSETPEYLRVICLIRPRSGLATFVEHFHQSGEGN